MCFSFCVSKNRMTMCLLLLPAATDQLWPKKLRRKLAYLQREYSKTQQKLKVNISVTLCYFLRMSMNLGCCIKTKYNYHSIHSVLSDQRGWRNMRRPESQSRTLCSWPRLIRTHQPPVQMSTRPRHLTDSALLLVKSLARPKNISTLKVNLAPMDQKQL